MRKILIGLGNPGEKYKNTYHNAGAIVLYRLYDGAKKSAENERGGDTAQFRFAELKMENGDKNVFVWPKTFMNESGAAVRAVMKFFDAKNEEVVILHDDSDIALGEGKLSNSKNPAGHNGLISIQKETGVYDFSRIRIGIRDPKEKIRRKAEDFVLKKISGGKLKLLYSPELTAT